MTHTKGIAIIAMVASLILVTGTAAAQINPNQATLDGSVNDQGQYSNTGGAASASTDGGNIYSANVSTEQSTSSWAGLYGNATGTLVLGDNTDRLYEWTAEGEYVFATTASSVSWTSLAAGDASALNTDLGYGDQSDNATKTFDSTGTVRSVSGTPIAQTYNGGGSQVWTTGLLEDTTNSNYLYTGVAQPDADETAYNGVIADYQAMVPATDGSATSYNLYLELQ